MILKSCSTPGFESQRLAIGIHGFAVVAQAFDAFSDFDESAERGHPQDFAMQHVADVMLLEERFPDVGLELFHSQRKPALSGSMASTMALHAIALLKHFRWVFYAFGPAQIARRGPGRRCLPRFR